MPLFHHHPYLSHIVRVAPRPAGVGLDFAHSCLSSHCGVVDHDDQSTWGVTTAAGTLLLGGPFRRVVPRTRGYRPLRVAVGAVEPAGWGMRPVNVTLELLPWSSRWSELALIAGPLPVRDRGNRAERAYLRAAHATLARLVEAIEIPPAEWLARLVAGQPCPQSEHVAVVHRPGRER